MMTFWKNRTVFSMFLPCVRAHWVLLNPVCRKSKKIKTSSTKKERCGGTTIIEVMIAILILAIMAVAVPAGMSYPRFLAVSAAHKQSAIDAANEAMEELVSRDYDAIPTGSVDLNFGTKYEVSGRSLPLGSQTVVEFNKPKYKRITIAASYYGGDHPVQLITDIAP